MVERTYASADEGSFELSPGLSSGPYEEKTSKGPLKFPPIKQQQKQLDEISKLLLENKKLPNHITGEEGLKDIKVIYKAAETGKKISIK